MVTLLYIGAWPFVKFIGFILFLLIAFIGFWCLTFLVCILPYWLTFGIAENKGKINAHIAPDEVKSKTLPQQQNVEVVYTK
ncbi:MULTISPECIES: hypothetical protein [unclassified Apibacter]|uniref:hypothetical protein n=1 Tax=unclassified Apibacter TaxID=2630820 RepID=UPI00132102D2|nr:MULTISPECIES: hypothetical protein [unclassified Apibacter]MCX8676407.1 hypothetical protein [Apibacter sp. B3919]MXO23871.1 hypothetical protein [Apibacter sp. B3924]MXO26451.1 hypothetical protein [Apibacter sp. B3813]MXO28403.1 hypothetical protein [Apibacter sp. B3913]MXO30357.1 hypothetical protein [Apibacter sp. B3912]